ncbi:[NiFe] hydrogenase metallocenter assembly protein HypE [Desulfovibrio sp. DV]|nr:[NiFe] hydrogenase metallocenter assembly protein HypE [Desulfovibrio sp. DV]
MAGGCAVLGLDPLYLANEGKFLCILPEAEAEAALAVLQADAAWGPGPWSLAG